MRHKRRRKKSGQWLWTALGGLAFLILIFFLSQRPSNSRDWRPDQGTLAWYERTGDSITVHNIRNATYRTSEDYSLVYYDATYGLRDVRTVDLFIEEFSSFRGLAHTMLSFGFADGRYLAISVEARKTKGESYSATRGLLRQYERMYVAGDESDLVRLRTNVRNDTVRRFEINTTPAGARSLLLSMLDEANSLREKPQFYNTLTSSCTTNLVKHANRVTPGRVPWSWRILLPGYADRLAYDARLIRTNLTFGELRESARIEGKARACGDCAEFSTRIRE